MRYNSYIDNKLIIIIIIYLIAALLLAQSVDPTHEKVRGKQHVDTSADTNFAIRNFNFQSYHRNEGRYQ